MSPTSTTHKMGFTGRIPQLEREANYAAAQLLFQGALFERRVLDLKESIHSALVLADEHETTFHSTLWAYVEAQDRPIAVAVYRKTDILGDDGFPIYRQSEVYAASPIADRYSGIELPHRIGGRHPWIDGLRAWRGHSSGLVSVTVRWLLARIRVGSVDEQLLRVRLYPARAQARSALKARSPHG